MLIKVFSIFISGSHFVREHFCEIILRSACICRLKVFLILALTAILSADWNHFSNFD